MIQFNTTVVAMAAVAFISGTAWADISDHHHHKLAPDIGAFHAVLAPVWHARPSPERLQNACAKVGDMTRLAGEIRSTNASHLVGTIASLKTSCESDTSQVDGALYDVHEAFHHVIDAKPAKAKR